MQVIRAEAAWTAEGVRGPWCVQVDDGLIVGSGPPERYSNVDVDLPGRLLLPGFVNAHSHAFQRAFRGHVQWRSGEHDDFWTWRRAMYATANALDPDGVEAVSRLAFLEMIEAGITTVGEFHYLHHDPSGAPYDDPDELARRVIAAARQVGLRICLLRVAYARGGVGRALGPEQRRFGDRAPDDVLDAIARLSRDRAPGVRVGLAPHSVRAVPRDWLRTLADFDGVVHAHVSEQPDENRACVAEHGASPLTVLADAGLVSERFCAVHLTHPLPGDLARLRAAGAAVCVCPSTELDLGDGFLPVDARSARLCIGSDSHARIAPLDEARDLELHARGLAGRRNVMAEPGTRHSLATRLLRAATVEGDRALGGAGQGIAVGAPADLVAIDLRRPAAEGVPPLEAAVFSSTPEWVDRVFVAGESRVEGGRHPARDAIVAAARPYLQQR